MNKYILEDSHGNSTGVIYTNKREAIENARDTGSDVFRLGEDGLADECVWYNPNYQSLLD